MALAQSICTTTCGDGVWVSGTEDCDDFNTADNDGCSSTCTEETGYSCTGTAGSAQTCSPDCGDGIWLNPEECDDGDEDDGDGCSSTCKVEDGWHQMGTYPANDV